MTKDEIRFLILRSIGNFLLLFAIFGVVSAIGPVVLYEAEFRIAQLRGVQYSVEASPTDTTSAFGEILAKQNNGNQSQGPGFAEVLAGPTQQILIPKDTDFSLLIPKIGASAKVIPNVDPGNEKAFLDVLQHGVAHAKGSVFPGFPGNTYLFAHSTDNFWNVGRYNAVFYLLKELVPGDSIVVFFENVRHNYTVTKTDIVDPSDVSALVKSQQGTQQKLILQTCWPPGTTWKRLLVTAEPIK